MTISTDDRKAGPFVGNGITDDFPFAFKVFQASEVLVVQATDEGIESTLSMGTDYTVTLNANQNTSPGGTVTLTNPLTTDYELIITSQVEELQPVDLTNAGGFYPSVINSALDRLTILVQQLTEKIGRAIKVPITSDADTTADALIADLNGLVAVADAAETASAASAAAAAASAAAAATFNPALYFLKAGDTTSGDILLDTASRISTVGTGMSDYPRYTGPSTQPVFRNTASNASTYVGVAPSGTGTAAGFYAALGQYTARMSITASGMAIGLNQSVAIPTPLPITFSMASATGVTFNTDGTITAYGIRGRQGTSGASPGNSINLYYTGSAMQAWVDTVNLGNITITSDYRIKRDIKTMDQPALERIAAIRPVLYKYAHNGDLHTIAEDREREGFIAHELAEVIPSAVEGEKDAYKQIQSLRVDAIIAVLVKGIQEQQEQINELRQRLES